MGGSNGVRPAFLRLALLGAAWVHANLSVQRDIRLMSWIDEEPIKSILAAAEKSENDMAAHMPDLDKLPPAVLKDIMNMSRPMLVSQLSTIAAAMGDTPLSESDAEHLTEAFTLLAIKTVASAMGYGAENYVNLQNKR